MSDSRNSDFTILSEETIPVPWYLNLFPAAANSYIKKKGSKILLGRDSEMIKAAWIRINIDVDLAKKVSKIIAHWCEWPNALFVPDDKCSILFQDINYDSTTIGAMMQIEDEIVPNLNLSVWSKTVSMSYGELIRCIETTLRDSRPQGCRANL